MSKLTVLTAALKQCAENYNPKDINDWTDKNTLPAMAVDLYIAIEKMGYTLERSVFVLEEPNNDPFLATNKGE